VLGRGGLIDDTRFATNRARVANRDALRQELAPVIRAKPAVWWLRALGRRHIACGIAHDFESFRHHQQIVDNGMIGVSRHPEWGETSVGGVPWKFERTPCAVVAPSSPGADTAAVKAWLAEDEAATGERRRA